MDGNVYALAADAAALARRARAAITGVFTPSTPRPSRIQRVRDTWTESKWRGALQAALTPIGWATDLGRCAIVGAGVVVAGAAGVVAFCASAVWYGALWVFTSLRSGADRVIGWFNPAATVEEAKA
jgi:hypothetical protein